MESIIERVQEFSKKRNSAWLFSNIRQITGKTFFIYIYNNIVSLIRALATELFVTDTKFYREVRKVTIEMDLDLLLKAHQLGWPLALKWLDHDKN